MNENRQQLKINLNQKGRYKGSPTSLAILTDNAQNYRQVLKEQNKTTKDKLGMY